MPWQNICRTGLSSHELSPQRCWTWRGTWQASPNQRRIPRWSTFLQSVSNGPKNELIVEQTNWPQIYLRELEEVIRLSNQRFGASQVVQFGSETAAAQIFFAVIELSFATFSHLGEHSSIVANNFILNQIKFVPEFALFPVIKYSRRDIFNFWLEAALRFAQPFLASYKYKTIYLRIRMKLAKRISNCSLLSNSAISSEYLEWPAIWTAPHSSNKSKDFSIRRWNGLWKFELEIDAPSLLISLLPFCRRILSHRRTPLLLLQAQ